MDHYSLRLFSKLTDGQFDRLGSADPMEKLLAYFSKLDALTRIEVLRNRFSIFKSLAREARDLNNGQNVDLSVVEMASLALAIKEHKTPSKAFYKKLRGDTLLSDAETSYAQNLALQRRSTKPKQRWLDIHGGTVEYLRGDLDMSWRKISLFLKEQRNQNISHVTLKEWYENR